MTNYTANLAINPGMQLGLAGYSPVNNSSISVSALTSSGTLFGNPGLFVSTPGVISEEGVLTPASTILNTVPHGVSVYIMGASEGSLTVSVIQNPGGTVLGTASMTLTDSYQRVILDGLSAIAGNTLSLMITTNAAEAVQFWIANIQIQPEPVNPITHSYCDGNQYGCFWTTTVGGTSFQPFQNTITATSNIIDGSNTVNALIKGEIFTASAVTAVDQDRSSLVTNVSAPGPQGAMTDFSIASLTDPDPALTYASWNNSGLAVPTSGYARSFGSFFPPQDYFVSGGQQLYKRAAFMAAGWQFSAMPNNSKVIVTDAQTELLPFTTGFAAAAPSNYVLPREVQTIIKPNRLNFCTNPSFETGLAGWSAVAGGILSQDTSNSVGSIISIDDQPEVTGSSSLFISVFSSGDGAQITIPNLIAGDTYIISAYVQAGSNVNDISITCGNGSASVVNGNSGTGYGDLTYGGGFYGGNPPASSVSSYGLGDYGTGQYGSGAANNLPTGQWFRIFTTFTPTDSSAVLSFTSTISSPTNFWVDAVLAEAGQVLGFYFDGNFGSNYFWETGGVAGLTRSYYYDQFDVKAQAVNNILARHTPLGISSAPPIFSQPYTQ